MLLRGVQPLVGTLRRLTVTAATNSTKVLEPKLAALREKLATGLEWSGSVQDSAQQLLLEHDPAQRRPRSHYLVHYQELARAQVLAALDEYNGLRREIGEEAMDAILKGEQAGPASLRVLIADSMLARDKLNVALREAERKEQANEIECPA